MDKAKKNEIEEECMSKIDKAGEGSKKKKFEGGRSKIGT